MDNERLEITESEAASKSNSALSDSEVAKQAVAKQTAGQLEREISQKIQGLYKKRLAHQTGRVTCQLFDTKVAIVLEDSVTQPIQLLLKEGQQVLAQKARSDLNVALQPLVKALIADILGVAVVDVLSDTSLSTGRTAIVGILAGLPNVRNPEAIPKSSKA